MTAIPLAPTIGAGLQAGVCASVEFGLPMGRSVSVLAGRIPFGVRTSLHRTDSANRRYRLVLRRRPAAGAAPLRAHLNEDDGILPIRLLSASCLGSLRRLSAIHGYTSASLSTPGLRSVAPVRSPFLVPRHCAFPTFGRYDPATRDVANSIGLENVSIGAALVVSSTLVFASPLRVAFRRAASMPPGWLMRRPSGPPCLRRVRSSPGWRHRAEDCDDILSSLVASLRCAQ
jgi:hypothetical protein